MSERSLRRALLAKARALSAAGLNRGSAGNLSVRCGDDGFLITPTGMAYDTLIAADMVRVGLDGSAVGRRRPSSEWRFHRDIYRTRGEAGAVVHTHSPFAVTLACIGRPIPSFHYMIARFGGRDVRCADYATFGSQELSDAILAALPDRRACLMAHHGMVVFGDDLEHAVGLAEELEALCEQYWRVAQLGEVPLLPDTEMDRVLLKFADYGRQ